MGYTSTAAWIAYLPHGLIGMLGAWPAIESIGKKGWIECGWFEILTYGYTSRVHSSMLAD